MNTAFEPAPAGGKQKKEESKYRDSQQAAWMQRLAHIRPSVCASAPSCLSNPQR